jgi:DtxR family Mn-dependent transcriptional regulator
MSITRSEQDYLKAIYNLQSGGRPVATSALADQLGFAAPSVTNMVGKLADAGLLRHTPYRGVELTPAGAAVALEVIRHHRLWELFLHRALGLPLDQVHEEAERLEHELSESLEEHMSRLLGDPTVDPHGDPIPGRDGQVAATFWPTLADLPIGRTAIVRRVPDSDADLLRYLQSLGLVPGAAVEVDGREPFDGPVSLRVGGVARVVGTGLAGRVFVEPTP